MMKQTSDPRKRTENLFLAVSALLVFFITTASPTDNDMWWHLRAGKEIWEGGKILLADTFSYTQSGAPWVNAFWLSDLGMYGLWKIGGFLAITIVVSLIAVTAMGIVYAQAEGSIYLRGILILIATLGARANWTPRPQLLSFLLLACLDYFLYRHLYIKRQPLWILTILFALWGNIHGGFIWGILLLLATITGEACNNLFDLGPRLDRKEIGWLCFWSIIASLALSLNPNGIALWQLPFQQVNVSLSIQEWLSPDFHQFYGHPLLWLFFLWIGGISFSKTNTSFTDLFKGLGFAYMFFFAQRNMGPYAIIIIPLTARALTQAFVSVAQTPFAMKMLNGRMEIGSSHIMPHRVTIIINGLIVGLLAALALLQAYFVSLPVRVNSKIPAEAVQWIKGHRPRGPIFNSYNWGGYLIWSLPEYPVFIDGRADLYGKSLVTEWMDIAKGTEKGYEALDKRKIMLIFLEPDWPLTNTITEHDWKLLYKDDRILVFGR